MQELIDMIIKKYATNPAPYVRQVSKIVSVQIDCSFCCFILYCGQNQTRQKIRNFISQKQMLPYNRPNLWVNCVLWYFCSWCLMYFFLFSKGFMHLVVVSREVFWKSQCCSGLVKFVALLFINKSNTLLWQVNLIQLKEKSSLKIQGESIA